MPLTAPTYRRIPAKDRCHWELSEGGAVPVDLAHAQVTIDDSDVEAWTRCSLDAGPGAGASDADLVETASVQARECVPGRSDGPCGPRHGGRRTRPGASAGRTRCLVGLLPNDVRTRQFRSDARPEARQEYGMGPSCCGGGFLLMLGYSRQVKGGGSHSFESRTHERAARSLRRHRAKARTMGTGEFVSLTRQGRLTQSLLRYAPVRRQAARASEATVPTTFRASRLKTA